MGNGKEGQGGEVGLSRKDDGKGEDEEDGVGDGRRGSCRGRPEVGRSSGRGGP